MDTTHAEDPRPEVGAAPPRATGRLMLAGYAAVMAAVAAYAILFLFPSMSTTVIVDRKSVV